MFEKIVCIETAGRMSPPALSSLEKYGKKIVLHHDIPAGDEEIIRRIGDADAVLVSFTSKIGANVLEACPNIKYIGMCCSLYGPESCNVDIIRAKELGISVTGVFDYGDAGVPEFVVSELARLLHGFGDSMWRDYPEELTGQSIGILGMGTTGRAVARALKFFGADVRYFSRTRRPDAESELGIRYMDFDCLLPWADIVCSCLNTNIALMHKDQFSLLGNGKIYVNTSIAPAHGMEALENWLCQRGNWAIGDLKESIDPTGRLQKLPNVISPCQASGQTAQAKVRLGEKVLQNIKAYLDSQEPRLSASAGAQG